MSLIYFIRHGQAGTRENYDVLSSLGEQQATLLGEHMVSQGIQFAQVYAGSMQRQRRTAEIVCDAFARAGRPAPEIKAEERWNEFSLISVYRAIAQRLSDESPDFARDFKEMQETLRRDPRAMRGATGRCDAAVIRAWMENRYSDYEGESWQAFRSRIRDCVPELTNDERREAIAVFTSATPIAILTGHALDLSEEKFLSILGVVYNTSVTVMRGRGDELRLFTFNSVSHLPAHLATLR